MTNFDRENCLIPEIFQIGKSIYTEHASFQPQVHRNTYEFCYMFKGNWDWWVENEVFEVKTGQIYMTKPGEVHGGLNNMIYPSEFYWLQVKFPTKGSLPFIGQEDYKRIYQAFESMGKRVFQALPDIPFYFESILNEHKSPNINSKIIVRSNLASLIISVLQSYNTCITNQEKILSPTIKDAIRYIIQNIEKNPTVEEIAQHIGISLTSLNKKFQDEVNDNPKHYINQQRIHHAKTLLNSGDSSVTEIAHRLGYSSSQYFATAFKHACGISPKEYKEKIGLSYDPTNVQDRTQE